MLIKHLAVAALAALALTAATAAHADRWIGPDKADHMAISAMIGVTTSMLIDDKTTAFAVAIVPGLLKEVYDSRQSNNYFSSKDLFADIIGAAIGVQTGHWILTHREKTTTLGYRQTF